MIWKKRKSNEWKVLRISLYIPQSPNAYGRQDCKYIELHQNAQLAHKAERESHFLGLTNTFSVSIHPDQVSHLSLTKPPLALTHW